MLFKENEYYYYYIIAMFAEPQSGFFFVGVIASVF